MPLTLLTLTRRNKDSQLPIVHVTTTKNSHNLPLGIWPEKRKEYNIVSTVCLSVYPHIPYHCDISTFMINHSFSSFWSPSKYLQQHEIQRRVNNRKEKRWMHQQLLSLSSPLKLKQWNEARGISCSVPRMCSQWKCTISGICSPPSLSPNLLPHIKPLKIFILQQWISGQLKRKRINNPNLVQICRQLIPIASECNSQLHYLV